ncbi:MAG: peptidase E [Saprospiraceae bacterium]|nr:peptidase E [Saprospiraceae bacterium]
MLILSQTAFGQNEQTAKKIFVTGAGMGKQFINYVASLTGKKDPKICFLPTASGDNPNGIMTWYRNCEDLDVKPYVLRVWISSYSQTESFEEMLLKMDAIIVGGGNTLNMIAIWKAQGIDVALKKAYDKGIVLAGGSAGSLCWFTEGTTDSRPKELSVVEGLGFLNYSHCPHYSSEASRRPLYHKNILSGTFSAGYACDDRAGILFVNEKFSKAVALDANNHSYFVSLENGQIKEEKLPSEIIK